MKWKWNWIWVVCLLQSYSDASELPSVLVYALQPYDAVRFDNNKLKDNVMRQLSKALNVEIKTYPCPWARCVKAIETGAADIIDDLFYAKDRAEYTYYLQPSYAVQTAGFHFFADNSRVPEIKQWRDLIGLRIGTLSGYKYFPEFDNNQELIKIDFLNVNTIVKMLLNDRIDVFISPPSFSAKQLSRIEETRRLTQQPFSHIQALPLYLGLSKKSTWYRHREIIEKHLKQLINNTQKVNQ